MTNQIEKEFFEAFGYIPEIRYYVADLFFKNGRERPYYKTKDELIKSIDKFNNDIVEKTAFSRHKEKRRFVVIKVSIKYPPITPEIILKLIEIILKTHKMSFYFDDYRNEYVFCYYIQTFTEDRKLYYKDFKLYYAVLKACTKLAPEIQDQVKAMFNGNL